MSNQQIEFDSDDNKALWKNALDEAVIELRKIEEADNITPAKVVKAVKLIAKILRMTILLLKKYYILAD